MASSSGEPPTAYVWREGPLWFLQGVDGKREHFSDQRKLAQRLSKLRRIYARLQVKPLDREPT